MERPAVDQKGPVAVERQDAGVGAGDARVVAPLLEAVQAGPRQQGIESRVQDASGRPSG